ncbi:MAG: hypothetical protein ACW99G_12260 [Candidatus Thorarchaeota archaeon]|jgi:hypothetical protein
MANKVTFDWDDLLIIVNNGVTELDVQIDLYSDWKEDVKIGDNGKHPIAFRNVGGDPISDTQNLGATYFLLNGWKIRPYEGDHQLDITGNLYTDPFGEQIIIPTLGDYTVLVNMQVSNLVDSSVARLDLIQLLNTVYIDTVLGSPGTDEGKGTPTDPVDNIVDAFTIANRDNLRSFTITGSLVLDRTITDWSFVGNGAASNSELDLNGYNVDKCYFKLMTLEGTMYGTIEAHECSLKVISGLDGTFRNCGLVSTFTLDDNSVTVFVNSYSEIPGGATPICNLGSNISANFRNHSGGLELRSCTAGSTVSVDLDPGHLVLSSTCTGGTVLVRGTGRFTDNSAGTTIVDAGLIRAEDVVLSRKIAQNKLITDPTGGTVTVYDDDGSQLLQAPLYEDAAGAQTYRGQGAERRERLQ